MSAPPPPTPAATAPGDAPRTAGEDTLVFEAAAPQAAQPYRWRHLKRTPAAEAELLADPDLPDSFAWAMLERDTQPRIAREGDVTLLILRGINRGTGAEPEDMISLRLAVSARRILSMELRRLPSIDRLAADFRAGTPPGSVGAFVLRLVELLREDAEWVLDALDADIARLEQTTLALQGRLSAADRAALTDARQDAIMLHRFIAPQATALETLARTPPDWLDAAMAMREEAEAFRRIGNDLDALRGRAQVLAEEINIALTERTNRIMLTLSVVSVVFLPLTFLTGLLGVNLAGIPFAGEPWAFWGFAALLAAVVGVTLWLARSLLG